MKVEEENNENQQANILLHEISGLLVKAETRALAVFLLNEIDPDDLIAAAALQFYFLKGKFLTILHKESRATDSKYLLQADKYFDELASTASLRNCKVQQEHLQLRIKTKLQIAELETDETTKLKMLNYIQSLCKNALRVFPKCAALLTIQKSIQS